VRVGVRLTATDPEKGGESVGRDMIKGMPSQYGCNCRRSNNTVKMACWTGKPLSEFLWLHGVHFPNYIVIGLLSQANLLKFCCSPHLDSSIEKY